MIEPIKYSIENIIGNWGKSLTQESKDNVNAYIAGEIDRNELEYRTAKEIFHDHLAIRDYYPNAGDLPTLPKFSPYDSQEVKDQRERNFWELLDKYQSSAQAKFNYCIMIKKLISEKEDGGLEEFVDKTIKHLKSYLRSVNNIRKETPCTPGLFRWEKS